MRHHITALALCLLALVAIADSTLALTPSQLWSQRFGGAGLDGGYAVAIDGLGNVIVTGSFTGTANFGGSDLTSAGSDDIFIAKYDATGAHLWSMRFGNTTFDRGYGVAVDASNNIVVTGQFLGAVNFGGGNLTGVGTADVFLAKYDASGAHVWSQRFGSSGGDGGNAVAVDGSGNVFVTGSFQLTVGFGGTSLTSAGGNDIFLAKYSASGVHQWSQSFGSTNGDDGMEVRVDASGNAILVGNFQLTVGFGGANLASAGGSDIVLARYNASGVHQWSQRFGGTGSDLGHAVALDGSGNEFLGAQFTGTVDFGGGNLVSAGSSDGALAAYNSAGVHQWSRRFGGSAASDGALGVAADAFGNVVIAGYFTGTADLGGGNHVSAGLGDIVIARYNQAGTYQWSRSSGDVNGESGQAIAVDGSGHVVATGIFSGTSNFGGDNLVSMGPGDAFLVKFDIDTAEPVISDISDVGNDQGRKVKIRFARSGHDKITSPMQVLSYEAYRRDDAPPALLAGSYDRDRLSMPELLANGWTFVGSTPAHGEDTYGLDVATIGDSTITLGPYYSQFYVRASTAQPLTFFDSPADSGYSLDNLAPGAPLNFVYDTGGLTWDESNAADFDFFTVYGANTDAFGSATVVDYAVASSLDVTASPYVYYYVTATDFSGNEGKPAKVNTLSGVGGTPRAYVLSVSNYPNPFNPGTTVSYTVPSRGAVSIVVYDAHGARVATLFHGERDAGAYTIEWDGRAATGATVSSGVYFARIEHASGTRSKKMVLLK